MREIVANIGRPRADFERLLAAQENPPIGFLITCAFELLLDIRELLIMQAFTNGAKETSGGSIIVPK